MILATFAPDGVITGHYHSKTHKEIPPTAVPLTDEEWTLSKAGRLWINPNTKAIVPLPERPSPAAIVSNGAWIVPVASQVAAKLQELAAACQAACEAGYTSSVLGSPHMYPTDGPYDQINLLGCHADAVEHLADPSWTQEITCVPEGAATSSRILHTAIQTLEVTTGVKAMIAASRSKYNAKKHYLLGLDQGSTTIEADIAALTWKSVE